MRKYLITGFFLLALLFQACDKNEESITEEYETVGLTTEINISDVDNEPYKEAISEVAFVARFHGFGGIGSPIDPLGNDTRIMLKVPFDENGTKLILPENPPQELMSNIASDIPSGFVISDTNAKTISFVEIATDMPDSTRVFGFLYMSYEAANIEYQLQYIYCDRAVTITGSGKDWWDHAMTYDLNLKKGWNMVVEKTIYEKDLQIRSTTHLMPVDMKWKRSRWIGGK
ncbi:hypothetical protein NXY11_08880 [Parabacteroides faecis]|uniref:hypothetical protein n=1 Tax=Parabacteroides faecis TaxID=1217282 RepID=UPI00216467EF|nr:hypothetical protein [Parabacteroides faecis]MCS2893071.1 hypothetical protein [Parabacteroides faecis]UVQ48319.1 hypothetical protein NXY11_08880 [Parabacteroides faecis]